MNAKKMSMLTLALFAAVAATTSGASAGGKRHFHGKHFHHNFHHHRGLRIVAGGGYGGCGFYRDMWHDTGLFRWKRRFYMCKGWW